MLIVVSRVVCRKEVGWVRDRIVFNLSERSIERRVEEAGRWG